MQTLNVKLPSKIIKPLFTPNRYKIFYGGRGSAKSESVARYLMLVAAYEDVHPFFKKSKILCCREHQISMRQSVYSVLKAAAEDMGISKRFTFTRDGIRSVTGSEFIFAGLHYNLEDIKSMKGITHCWIEEAQAVAEVSWQVLIPTIRMDHSEIIATWNPNEKTDPVWQRFVENPPDDATVLKLNYVDNPFFPDVLRREMEYDKASDYEAYRHIWLGECRASSSSQVFYGKYEVKDFNVPSNVTLYYGADWGFSQDPSTLVEMFVFDNCLYISKEAYGICVDIDELPQMYMNSVPDARFGKIWADEARPETISYLKKHTFKVRLPNMDWANVRFNIDAAEKWHGSVEDGVAYIRKFKKIYIHPSCKHTLKEFELYSYKVDRLTGDVTTQLVDKHNHCIDAIRYGLQRLIKGKNLRWLDNV